MQTRLQKLLEQQCQEFRQYLAVLKQQLNSIETEDADALCSYAEMAEQAAARIRALQKVILPAERMYARLPPSARSDDKDSLIPVAKRELEVLREQAVRQNSANRARLKIHMESVRSRLSSLHNPYKSRLSIYARTEDAGRLIREDV